MAESYGLAYSPVGDTKFVHLAEYVTYGPGVSTEVRKANRTGFKTAYDLANKHGKTLYLDPGDLEIEIDETGDFDGIDKPFWIGVRLDGDVNIVGAGITRTRIKFFPDTPTFNAYAFFQPAGRHNSISDCTITGPAVGIGTPEDDGLPHFHGIKHQGEAKAADIADETLTLRNVKIDGKFLDALVSNEGDLICTLDGCDFSTHLQGVGYFVSSDTHKQLIIKNSYFHDSGFAFNAAALVYVSPGVAIDISHSRFSASLRYGVYINGSSAVKPLYSRITNNVFEDTLAHAIQVTKNNRPLIQGNVIKTYARGVAFFGSNLGAEVIDNEFIQTEAAAGAIEGDYIWESISGLCERGALIKVRGNTFDASLGRDVGLGKVLHMDGAGVIWDVSDNVFRLNHSNLSGIIGSAAELLAFVSGNKFTGETCAVCMQFDGGKIYAQGNIVETGSGRAFSFIQDTLVKAYVDDNYVNASTEGLHISLTSASDEKIEGGGNTFLKDSLTIVNNNSLFNFQMITPRQGVSPKVVLAAAEEVKFPLSYDTFHVAGTGPIKWFYFRHGFATRVFSGEIRIIFDDEGATIVEGGNIKPQTTAARAVGRVYRFMLDSRTGFWWE